MFGARAAAAASGRPPPAAAAAGIAARHHAAPAAGRPRRQCRRLLPHSSKLGMSGLRMGHAATAGEQQQLQRRREPPRVECQAGAAAGEGEPSRGGRRTLRSSFSKLHPPLLLKKAVKASKRGLIRLRNWLENSTVKLAMQYAQFVLAIVFVFLYVYATYIPPMPDSLRHHLDILLCVLFALEYLHRLLTAESKLRMVTSLWNIADLLSFAPPLLQAALRFTGTSYSLAGVDLRWFKILRSMRVLRIGLLSSELRSLHLSTRRGGWLSAGANFRLFQLFTSIGILLFTTTAIIQIVERMPFHQALYLVVTTLTTVGFGDIVATSILGKMVVIATIAVGVVLIPVQAGQFYAEFTARRVVRGSMPSGDKRSPMVLLSTRLTEVRAFSDFYSEFQQALSLSPLFPNNTKMLVLSNRPSYEFGAFQEMHEKRITFMEGSAVSGQDLCTARAERARACLLLADRFTTDPEQEDLSILFQVWAMKSYTKTVPLYVQTVRQAMVEQISPFLDPGQDVVVSMEQTRLRLLALSAVCPGASTLIGNLLKSSAVRPEESQQRMLAGREWLRAYVNGCAFQFIYEPVPGSLVGRRFLDVAEWLFCSSGIVLLGLIDERERMLVNPADLALPAGATMMVIGTTAKALLKALKQPYSRMLESERQRIRVLPQEAAAAAGGGSGDGEQSWLLETMDTSDEMDPLERAVAAGADGSSSSSSSRRNGVSSSGAAAAATAGGGGGGDGGAAPAVLECVPLLVGNPDSESLDADSVPCVSLDLANRLTTPAAVKAFVQQYQQNRKAQEEQQRLGSIQPGTAEAMAAEATAAVAAAAANGSLAAGVSGSSVDYGGCAIDWNTQQTPSTRDTFTAGSSSRAATGGGGGAAAAAPWQLSGHYIVCGAEESFCSFVEHLRKCGPKETPIVVLHPTRPEGLCDNNSSGRGGSSNGGGGSSGPIHYVEGSASEAGSLRAAGASSARALIYLARAARPVRSAQGTGQSTEKERSTREAVLADAQALLAVYGVGEESGAELTHAVVELLFTTSIEFLQPGLLLKGVNLLYDDSNIPAGQPRKSWLMRAWQQREAVSEGLAEWQANPYFAAGRVTVPALLDTFACQSFFNEGVLIDLLAALSGDDEEQCGEGAALQQVPVPAGLAGRPYGECFIHLALTQRLVCLGLYRRKSENPGTRLSYVVCSPKWHEVLEATDRVFVLRPREVR